MRHTLLLPLLALVLMLPGCVGPVIPDARTGETRYLCCNLHYEKPKITDVTYQVGTMVPFGTQVKIVSVRRNAVEFQPVGYPTILMVLKAGDKQLTIDQLIDQWFVTNDPRRALKKVPAKRMKLIEQGIVDDGMTKTEVKTALGIPPAHRTPTLDSSEWHYWQNRWAEWVVYFDGDKVVRIQR
jgi:hypothetical protein